MKGTDDELQFGDQIELDVTKDEGNKTVHRHIDCKFVPELVELLLENDIIEQRETGTPDDFEDDEELINYILNTLEDLSDRMTALEGIIADKKAKK